MEFINGVKCLDISCECDSEDPESPEIFPLSFASEESKTLRELNGKQYVEHLLFGPGNVDFSRLIDGGLPLLTDHDQTIDSQVGRVESITHDEVSRKLRGFAVFSQAERACEIKQQVKDGILRSLSFGYMYSAKDITWYKKDGVQIGEVAKWTPYEVSIVAIPEDVTVGFNKALDVCVVSEAEVNHVENMAIDESIKKIETEVKAELIEAEKSISSIQISESPIIFKENNKMEINTPVTTEFNKHIAKEYSIVRHLKGLKFGAITGAEKEVCDELGSYNIIPAVALTKTLNLATAGSGKEVATPAFGGYLEQLLPQSFMGKLGLTILNLAQATTFPAIDTPASTAVSQTDGSGASQGAATTRSVTFASKAAVAQFPILNTLIDSAQPGIEAYIISQVNKMSRSSMEKNSLAIWLSEITTNVQTETAMTGAHVLALADMVRALIDTPDSAAFLTTPAMASVLAALPRLSTGQDRSVLENGLLYDLPFVSTAQLTGVVSGKNPLIFGAWANAMFATFGQGVRVSVDNSSQAVALTDSTVVTTAAHYDTHIMDKTAFAKNVSVAV